jgi:hypothetical protein
MLVVYTFLRTQNFELFRIVQLALFLFFAFIVQWSIGSFVSSSGIFDFYLASGDSYGIPTRTIAVFFVLSFTIVATVMWLLLRYYVQKRDTFQEQLSRQHALVEIERNKSDQLLKSLLPEHVA